MFERWLTLPKRRSVLLIGPRRAGKTTFLRGNYADYRYATLDDFDEMALARSDPKGFVRRLGSRAIIDEIQRYPELTIAVKFAIDNEGARFLMSGSSTLGLLDVAADTMAGRVDIRSLPTACWGEDEGPPTHDIFDEIVDIVHLRESYRRLPDALLFGQFPEVLGQTEPGERQSLLRNYRDTYFMRDLMQLASLENAEGLHGILLHLARSIGSILEVSAFARESGLSFPTAKKYLRALAQSQLVFRLSGYQYGPDKRQIKAAKSYFTDVGVLQSLNADPSGGQILESFVIAELEKRRKLGLRIADSLHFYRSQSGSEIDCVWEESGSIYAVEIKASRRVALSDARRLRDFEPSSHHDCKRYLFYTGDEYFDLDGVRAIPVAALYRGR